jgi:hypothetical protein
MQKEVFDDAFDIPRLYISACSYALDKLKSLIQPQDAAASCLRSNFAATFSVSIIWLTVDTTRPTLSHKLPLPQ